MAQNKPVQYPNLVDQISKATETGAAIHEAVKTHVQEHRARLEAQRKQLQAKQMAKKLIESDGKS